MAYDIANHFCEMAADYHTETPHIMDYSKYPGKCLFQSHLSLSFEMIEDQSYILICD